MIRATAAAIGLFIVLFAALDGGPAGAQTGGQIIPCPGSPYNNGWFDTWNAGVRGSVNCSQQNNHIVVDPYNSEGKRTQAAIDTWYGGQCDSVSFVQPAPGLPFRINLRNNSYGQVWAPGCGTEGATILGEPVLTAPGGPPPELPVGGWWSARVVNTSWAQTVNMCHVTPEARCGALDGFTVVNTHGINKGPFVAVGFGGASPLGKASTFVTSISVHVNS